ncbi:P-loop containing nucleoside triphosphate hydrolase protein [Dacryopinax primogenitus]|uniref:Structural maintenance of chromosomes protein 5 n=1 Tax=Dacryopinax primogenitus (strain DJM 731) TaxID=1858805 RepID=M5GFX3_DACPD|nr:P-loop containing nucleoside triphosphate hydrolase protein [Dacryopinax primogenitus]EJU06652.1 P-loop containing nucleoside triphosphate hydrolase protein [Dacryopinax primogenitus]
MRTEDDEPEQAASDDDAGEAQAGPSGSQEEDPVVKTDEDDDESLSRRKRARLDKEGSSRVSKEEKLVRREPSVRDRDGYVPGSIVRIALENFMTYDSTEFRPCPYLNMVLGPNGTGKSSIASAIAIGLGFSPSLLGRSSSVHSYVKHGAESGWIEIELKGKPGQGNLIIRRGLVSNNDSSTYLLNGKNVPAKAVKDAVEELNVQVANLCAFLPQDRVSEFAQLTPEKLLIETQKAAGAAGLTRWHEQLIDMGKDRRKITEETDELKKDAEYLEQRNSVLERDVARFRERREIEKQIALLELQIPFAAYAQEKAKYDELKEERNRQSRVLAPLLERNDPLNVFKAEQEERKRKVETKKKKMEDEARKMYSATKKLHEESMKLADKADEKRSRVAIIRKNEKERKERIKKLKAEIARYEQILADPPDFQTPLEENKQKRRALQDELPGFNEEKAKYQQRYRAFEEEKAVFVAEKERASELLKELDNRSEVRLRNLERFDKDCADAVRWLRTNLDKFEMEVVEPAIISLTVPDNKYLDAVESCFNVNQLKTFVCQTEQDFKTLNQLVNDTDRALGRKARINTWHRPRNQAKLLPPPLSLEEVQHFGFDGYAINFVEAPDAMHWYLRRELNMHRTLIGLDASQIDNRAAADAVSAQIPGQTGTVPPATFIAGRVSYTVSRSAYGKRLVQQQTRDLRPGRNLNNVAVDQNYKNELIEKRAMATQSLTDMEATDVELQQEDQRIKGMEKGIKDRKDELDREREKIKQNEAAFRSHGSKLTIVKNKLLGEENAPSADQERSELRAELLENARERTRLGIGYTNGMAELIEKYADVTELGLESMQLASNIAYLVQLGSEQGEARKEAEAAYREIDEQFKRCKQRATDFLNTSRAKLKEADDDIKDAFQQNKDAGGSIDLDDLEQQLEAERARFQLNMAVNPSLIRKYEEQKAEAERKRRLIAEKERSQGKYTKKIKGTEEKWLPALEQLIFNINEKFSDAFARVQCVGEVKIGKDEHDYAKWRIEIWVKFRDNEQLQLLTAHRQSGGERALCTILYLMSLTELARAPFSLVDEINQGMDQRYERAVHNNLVEVTCAEGAMQYFLITPKLLPDLKYHKRMRILCVNNGEWLTGPQNSDKWGNMRKMLHHARYYPLGKKSASLASPVIAVR